jgi:hypothetical protein
MEEIVNHKVRSKVGEFLGKNGFEDNGRGFFNEYCSVIIEDDHYCVEMDQGHMFSKDLNIYWLIGVLTHNGLMNKNYIQ